MLNGKLIRLKTNLFFLRFIYSVCLHTKFNVNFLYARKMNMTILGIHSGRTEKCSKSYVGKSILVTLLYVSNLLLERALCYCQW